MIYDFDEIVDRRHSNSYKWDVAKDDAILPMWIADMDFRTAQPIIDALALRVQHGIFGYTKVPDEYFDAITAWFCRRHNFVFDKSWLLYTTGVVPAISAVIMALTNTGDKVIVQGPVYNCFFSSVLNNNCELVSNDLIYHNGTYTIDFEDLEQKAKDPKTTLLLLCNPHNPAGRVWTREELLLIGEICIRNNVFVVVDEIHCDLIYPGFKHIPFASLHNNFLNHSVTCTAPTKTFNLAGLQVANILAADPEVRKKIDKALNINEVCDLSPFAVEALTTAYNHGEEWLDQLIAYLHGNIEYLRIFFKMHLPQFPILPLEGTYLVWIDCSSLKHSSKQIAKTLLDHSKIWVNEGTIYGNAGEGFIRINIACPRPKLQLALIRVLQAFSDEKFQ